MVQWLRDIGPSHLVGHDDVAIWVEELEYSTLAEVRLHTSAPVPGLNDGGGAGDPVAPVQLQYKIKRPHVSTSAIGCCAPELQDEVLSLKRV